MRVFPYKKVNAFTSEHSRGNPAAFLVTDEELTGKEMLEIAGEHKGFVSEVVFVTRKENRPIRLTYYSSECEVSFCGHGTIATLYELLQTDRELRKSEEIEVQTNRKGLITVYNFLDKEDAVYISAPDPVELEIPSTASEIAGALGMDLSEINKECPVEMIDAGLKTLIVPVAGLEKEVSVTPDQAVLKSFCLSRNIDIVLIHTLEADNPRFYAHTRVFAPKFGYLEDPATGSGNSAFGFYLLKHGIWDGRAIRIEQGGKGMAFNEIRLVRKDERILFGGRAEKVIEGVYLLR